MLMSLYLLSFQVCLSIHEAVFLYINITAHYKGYTTALQLRVTPKYDKDMESGVYTLLPKRLFDFYTFITGKLVGILPVLWLALLLWAPMWHLENTTGDTPATRNHLPGIK